MDPSEVYINALISNNNGALAMEKGNFEVAKNSFRKALALITSIASLETRSTSRCMSVWSNNAPLKMKDVCCTAEGQATFVFKRSLILLPESSNDPLGPAPLNLDGYAQESAAVVFNIALSHHLIALSTNRSDMLERALKFYEFANSIRQRQDASMEIIDLALLNNVGQAQHEFCNYSTARECFDMLTKRLILLKRQGAIRVLEKCDCNGFVLNSMMEQPTMAAAAWSYYHRTTS